jgi:hypothetical protein
MAMLSDMRACVTTEPLRSPQHDQPKPPASPYWCLSAADRGRADVKIHGRGMSIDIDIQPALPVPTPEKPVARSLGQFGRARIPQSHAPLCACACVRD